MSFAPAIVVFDEGPACVAVAFGLRYIPDAYCINYCKLWGFSVSCQKGFCITEISSSSIKSIHGKLPINHSLSLISSAVHSPR